MLLTDDQKKMVLAEKLLDKREHWHKVLTDDQRKMLTEKLLKECWTRTATARQCADCTYSCPISTRTFLTPQDLMDCKEALVKKELWEKFHCFAIDFYKQQFLLRSREEYALFDLWLFRTTDENGEAHFCRLVAEFMEAQQN